VLRVMAADDTPMSSLLLTTALQGDGRFDVLEPVSDISALKARVVKRQPEVILMSTRLGNASRRAFALAKELRELQPEIKIIMLLDDSESIGVVEAFRAGASGVLCRGDSLQAVAKCIWRVGQGQIWANSRELGFLLENLRESLPSWAAGPSPSVSLSRRERELVGCVARGMSNRQIAQKLGLAQHTVKNYLYRLFEKLGISKRVELVLYAYREGTAARVTWAPPAQGARAARSVGPPPS
jgi:two-component system nitrate/nitrite response regulator NarL